MDKRMLQMNDVVSKEELMNDFQHTVSRTVERYGHETAFPKLDDYHVTQADVDNYLFDKQAVIDSEGSERSRYTLAALIIMLPILVIAAFPMNELPWKENTIFAAVAVGIVLYLIVRAIQKMFLRMRMKKVDASAPSEKEYVDAVLRYRQMKNNS